MSDRVGRSSRLTGIEFHQDGGTKLNESSPRDFNLLWKFSTASRLRIGGRVMFDMCTGRGILQAGNYAVHLTVGLCDLVYVSSEQDVLRCSEPFVTGLQCTGQDSCSNQGGSGSKRWLVLEPLQRYDRMDSGRRKSRTEARHTLLMWSVKVILDNFNSEVVHRRFERIILPPTSAESPSTSLRRRWSTNSSYFCFDSVQHELIVQQSNQRDKPLIYLH